MGRKQTRIPTKRMVGRLKIAIVQPWLPQYRIPFYAKLKQNLAETGIELSVLVGETPPEWRDRNDSLQTSAIAEHLTTRFFRIGSQHLIWRSVREINPRKYDLIILEQAVRNLDTYALLALHPRKVAFWGHGRTFTKSIPRAQEALKMSITRRGRWFFGYTDEGVDAVAKAGFPRHRTTSVGNTVDTSALSAELAALTNDELAEFKQSIQGDGPICLALGAVDDTKRIDFLIRSLDGVRRSGTNARLLVAGDGSLRATLEHETRGQDWITFLGPTFGKRKALALAASDVIVNPGRVGLIAVDSFVSERPIIATRWYGHAPEFAYLRHGFNAIICDDDEDEYARTITKTLEHRALLSELKSGCAESAQLLTMDSMVGRFADGVRAAIEVRA